MGRKNIHWSKLTVTLCSGLMLGLPVFAKKNVVFLMADDFNYWAKCIGYQPAAQTPRLDQLASKGVLFTSGMCSAPVCNPSRNAMWSGFRPSTTMIQGNQDGFVREKKGFENIVTMHQYFVNNGYFVLGSGKMWHPGKMGSEETDPNNWSEIITDGTGCNGGSYKKYNGSKYGWSGNTSAMTESNCSDYALAKKIASRIANYHTSANKDKPFFIGCGLFRPHADFNSPKSFWDKFDASQIKPGPGVESQYYAQGTGVNNHIEINAAGVWNDGIHAYLASMALSDYNLGIILDAVDASPLKDSIIICFMGDHGWDLGEHGRWGKFSRWNSSNNTTMIIYDPSAKGNGQVCSKPVSMQDMYRTLIDLCDLPKKNDVEGYSIAHLLDCPSDEYWKHPAVMSYGGVNYIKTEQYYFINDGNDSQLYDNIDDPYQWNNLYGKSAYNAVIANLKHQIDSIVQIGQLMKSDLINYGTVKPEHYFYQEPEAYSSCVCEDSVAPSAPGTITLVENTPGSLYIQWEASKDNEGISGYQVFLDEVLKTTAKTNETILADLDCSAHFNIKVRAFDACKNVSAFSESIVLSTQECDNTPPSVPEIVEFDNVDETSFQLYWIPSVDQNQLAGYEVYVNGTLFDKSADTTILVSGLNCNRFNYIKIRAFDESMNYSDYTPQLTVRTEDCPPCEVNNSGGNGAEEGQSAFATTHIPGIIEAEYFDLGGPDVAYYDVDERASWAHASFRVEETIDIDELDERTAKSGAVIGGVIAGEWAEYTVTIDAPGEYELTVSYRCNGDKQLYFKLDNEILNCKYSLHSTGTSTKYYDQVLDDLFYLPAGEHVFAWVSESSSAFNINSFSFKLLNPSTDYHVLDRNSITYLLNPMADQNKRLFLDLTMSDPTVEVQIYDVNGRMLQAIVLSGERDFVPLDLNVDIVPGIYMIKIVNDLTESVEKFVVN